MPTGLCLLAGLLLASGTGSQAEATCEAPGACSAQDTSGDESALVQKELRFLDQASKASHPLEGIATRSTQLRSKVDDTVFAMGSHGRGVNGAKIPEIQTKEKETVLSSAGTTAKGTIAKDVVKDILVNAVWLDALVNQTIGQLKPKIDNATEYWEERVDMIQKFQHNSIGFILSGKNAEVSFHFDEIETAWTQVRQSYRMVQSSFAQTAKEIMDGVTANAAQLTKETYTMMSLPRKERREADAMALAEELAPEVEAQIQELMDKASALASGGVTFMLKKGWEPWWERHYGRQAGEVDGYWANGNAQTQSYVRNDLMKMTARLSSRASFKAHDAAVQELYADLDKAKSDIMAAVSAHADAAKSVLHEALVTP